MRVNDNCRNSRATTASVVVFGTAAEADSEEEDNLSVKSEARCLIKLNVSTTTHTTNARSISGTAGNNNAGLMNYCRMITPQQIIAENEKGGRVSFPLLLELIQKSSSFGTTMASLGGDSTTDSGVDSSGGRGNNSGAKSTTSSIWCTYQDQDGNTVLIATSEELRYAIKTQGADDILNLDVKIQREVQDRRIQDNKEEEKEKQPSAPVAASSSPSKAGLDQPNDENLNNNNTNTYIHQHHHHHYDLSASFHHALSTSLQAMEGRLLTKLHAMEDSILKKQQEGVKDLQKELLAEAKLLMTSSQEEEEKEEEKEGSVVTTTTPPLLPTDHLCRKKGLQRASHNQEQQALPSAQAMIVQEPPYLPLVDHDTTMNLMEQGISTVAATATSTIACVANSEKTRDDASSSLCLGVVASPPPPTEVVLATSGLEEEEEEEVTTAECHWVLGGSTTGTNSNNNDTTTNTTTNSDTTSSTSTIMAAATEYGRSGLKSRIFDLEKINKTLRDELKEAREIEDTLKIINQMTLLDKDMEIRKLQERIDFRRCLPGVEVEATNKASTGGDATIKRREEEEEEEEESDAARGTDRTQPFVFRPTAQDPPCGGDSQSKVSTIVASTGMSNTRESGLNSSTSSDMAKRRKLAVTSECLQEESADSVPVVETAATKAKEDQALVGILSDSVIPVLKSSIFQKMAHYNDKRLNGMKELKEDIESCTNMSEGWNKTILDGMASQTKALKNRLNDRTEKIVRRISQLEACCSDINKNHSKTASDTQKLTEALETMQKEQADLRSDIKILIQAIVKEADKDSKEEEDDDSLSTEEDKDGSCSSSSSNSSSSSASSLGASSSSSSSSSPSDESVYTSVPGSVPGSVTVMSDKSVYTSVPGNVTVKSSSSLKLREANIKDSDGGDDDDDQREWNSVADSSEHEEEVTGDDDDKDGGAKDKNDSCVSLSGESSHRLRNDSKHMKEELEEANVVLSREDERRVSRLRDGIAFYQSKRNKKMVARLKLKIALICARAGTTTAAATAAAACLASKSEGSEVQDKGKSLLTRRSTPAPVSRGARRRRASGIGTRNARMRYKNALSRLVQKETEATMDRDNSSDDEDSDDDKSMGSVDSLILYGFGDDSSAHDQHSSKASVWKKK